MAVEFKLPDLGENIEGGDVLSVLVQVGDVLQPHQAVLEIETDKATVEVPCPQGGRVVEVLVKAGDTVPVGAVLLRLEPVGSGASAPAARPAAPAVAPATAAPAKAAPPQAQPAPRPAAVELPADDEVEEAPAPPPRRSAPAMAPRPAAPARPAAASASTPARPATPSAAPPPHEGNGGESSVAASPSIRRLARELGIDLARVEGTGDAGRITREDVMSAVRQATSRTGSAAPGTPVLKTPALPGTADEDAWGSIRREKLTKIRKTIAANMVRSHTTIPHVTNFDDADITELERIRKNSASDYVENNVKLTTMVFVMKAVAIALKQHPLLNASLDEEQEQLIYKEYVNIGVAVDTPRGLVVPVVRNVDRLTIPQLAYALTNVANQARENRFALDDLRGGSFTISNLGAVGGTYSTPIINHPEVAVLLTGRARKLPVVVDDKDKLEVRLMLPLSLSYDHRLVDGAAAARFLNEAIGLLEAPGRLLLAP